MRFAVRKEDIVAGLTNFLPSGEQETIEISAEGRKLTIAGEQRGVYFPVEVFEPGKLRLLSGRMLKLRAMARDAHGLRQVITIAAKKDLGDDVMSVGFKLDSI